MASGKKGLGGGLSNLFGDTTVVDLKTETSADSVSKIAVSRIEPNPGQPRKVFTQEALDELAESIRLHGVITPITVRAGKKEGYYQIIAGERRWRAARQAGLDEIPAMVACSFAWMHISYMAWQSVTASSVHGLQIHFPI